MLRPKDGQLPKENPFMAFVSFIETKWPFQRPIMNKKWGRAAHPFVLNNWKAHVHCTDVAGISECMTKKPKFLGPPPLINEHLFMKKCHIAFLTYPSKLACKSVYLLLRT